MTTIINDRTDTLSRTQSILQSIYRNYPMLVPDNSEELPVLLNIVTHKTKAVGSFNVNLTLTEDGTKIKMVTPTALVVFSKELREFTREIMSLSLCSEGSESFDTYLDSLIEISLITQLIKINDLKHTYDRFTGSAPGVYHEVENAFFTPEANSVYANKFLNFFDVKMKQNVTKDMNYCVQYFKKAYQ